MKKEYVLSILILACLFSPKLEAQVPNGGFEDWFDNNLFSEPLPYFTSNFQSYLETGESNVTEVVGVNNSAVRLETIDDGNEIVPGTMVLANVDGDDFSGGYPFTSEPDSITGYFRYSVPNGDTAAILLIFTSNGFPVNITQVPIVGEALNFTYQAFEIPDFFLAPDTVTVIITSSGANVPAEGSWLEIDDLLFTNSSEQLPNSDFDNWTVIETEEPEDWFSTNFISVLSDSPVAATKSTDAHTGNFALRLETVEVGFFGEDPDTIGYISTGAVGEEGIEGGFPYTGQPDKLTGFYKYTPSGNDTAVVNLIFSKYNSATGETDELFDYIVHLPPTSNYTEFEIPIELTEVPDTANVTIGSSNYAEEENFIGVGSVLLIDDIQFEFVNGTSSPLFVDELLIYPNPADNYASIDLKSINGQVESIIFFDAMGRKVIHMKDPNQFGNTVNINTNQLDNGIYMYLIITDAGDYSGKLQIDRRGF